MTDRDRYQLLFGPYTAPTFRVRDVLFCEVRGPLIACGLSDRPIPWPVGKPGVRSSAPFVVVTSGLAEALRRESAQAVRYWWELSKQTVTRLRQALGVPLSNEGTYWLRHDHALEPGVRRGLRKAMQRPPIRSDGPRLRLLNGASCGSPEQ